MADYKVDKVVAINFYENENGTLINIPYNSHYLVNAKRTINGVETTSGLIDLSVDVDIENSNSQGGIRFQIVRGSSYAYIENTAYGDKIVFTGRSNKNPIVVRCYSIFNTKVSAYVVFFTQYGMSQFALEGNNLFNLNDGTANYQLTTHTGAQPTLVRLKAENKFEGQNFYSILSSNSNVSASNFKVEAEGYNKDVLDVNTSSINGIQLGVKTGAEITGNAQELVNIKLYLNLTEYYGENYFPQIDGVDQYLLLNSSSIRVLVYESATGISITDGGEEFKIQSNGNASFNVNLETGYMDDTRPTYYGVPYEAYNNSVTLKETNKDSISLELQPHADDDGIALAMLLSKTQKTLAELFDYTFDYTEYKLNSKAIGYTYSVNIQLKNEFDYRFITSNIVLKITINR